MTPDTPADVVALAEAIPEPCGGCGEPDPGRRCIGCMHDFFPDRASSVLSGALIPRPAEPAQAAQVDLVAKLPRLTEAMIIAACKAHYGSKIVDQLGIDGIDLATEAREYTFRDGFKRMWSGVRAVLRANATDASEGER